MEQLHIPHERLRFFRKQLGLSAQRLAPLAPYARDLAGAAEDMARQLYAVMGDMAQTKIILEHQTSPERLQANWRAWYVMLWERPCDDELLAALWHSGLRHVAHGVDHRFITLAYSLVRDFSQRVIREVVPQAEREQAHLLADKLFDLCLLVETDAFIAAQSHCSNDVMMGLAHQLRNPLTVIGGMTARLLRTAGDSALQPSLEAVLEEAGRLERMLADLVSYITVLRNEPVFQTVSLAEAVEHARQRLTDQGLAQGLELELRLDPDEDLVQADPTMLGSLLRQLLLNAQEAQPEAAAKSVLVRTPPPESRRNAPGEQGHFVTLEVCNPGTLPPGKDTEPLFQPFHSTKSFGTGLGLAIARLGAQKNFGTVQLLAPTAGEVCCRVTLVRAGHVHESGLFFGVPQESGF